ncbi:MAG: dihydrolipoyl dehydrogenase [Armatimonadota bacterium]|nr:MAG: dihydrolipoyl dehydrogenase [Armatimonadota bacterium]
MASQEFDLVVIGAGPGGYTAAIRAAQLGMRVACVEKEDRLGGTCLRVGCIPSKALLEATRVYSQIRGGHLSKWGIKAGDISVDIPAMMRQKDRTVDTLARGIESLFRKNGVAHIRGAARLAGNGRVEVEGSGTLQSARILIATGSHPATIPGVRPDGDRVGTSTDALSWDEAPAHLAVIGAGYIGLELGSVWSRLGSKVTVLEFLPRILPGVDSEVATEAQKIFKKQGLEFRLQARVSGVTCQEGRAIVHLQGGDDLECDRVLVATGRVPCTDSLGLEEAGVQTDEKGRIIVDESFQTTAPGIFAIGDVIAGPMLAHKAEEEGVACVERMATGHGHVDHNLIPGVVYTDPEIASVGRTEDELREQGTEYRKGVFPFKANSRARCTDATEGFVKVLADAKTDRVLGIHILGSHAGDLIAEATAAITFGASSEDIARTCHAHPTLAEAIKEAALAVDGRAINF